MILMAIESTHCQFAEFFRFFQEIDFYILHAKFVCGLFGSNFSPCISSKKSARIEVLLIRIIEIKHNCCFVETLELLGIID